MIASRVRRCTACDRQEVTAILELFEQWGDIDRSHRKLAHRGSYTHEVWVSPATVRRVLAAHGLVLKRPRRIKSERRPFPEWADYRRNSIWIYDVTHFVGCPKHAVFAIMDLVTRKWICELVSIEETSTQVQVVFMDALESEGLMGLIEARQDQRARRHVPLRCGRSRAELAPILLAVSDNGPQMTSGSTREFMAMCAIAQHFGRPGTPTDQAWIESCSPTSKPNGRTWIGSVTRRSSEPNSPTSATNTTRSDCTPGSDTSPRPTSTTAAAHGSAPPANADSDKPAGHGSPTINYRKPKPTAGAPPMWTDSLPDLWL